MHGHTDSKSILQYAFFEVPVQRWTFTISLPNFLFSDFYLCLYLYCFPKMQHALRSNYNLSRRKKEYKNKNSKICDFLSEMPFDKGSSAMVFEIKEIKRQSRAVKVTHPPAERRQLHKRSDSGLSLSNADHRSSNARHKTCRGAASQVQ